VSAASSTAFAQCAFFAHRREIGPAGPISTLPIFVVGRVDRDIGEGGSVVRSAKNKRSSGGGPQVRAFAEVCPFDRLGDFGWAGLDGGWSTFRYVLHCDVQQMHDAMDSSSDRPSVLQPGLCPRRLVCQQLTLQTLINIISCT